jgi:pyruvate formate lyase activating enzyme
MHEAWCYDTLRDKKVKCNLCIIGCAIYEGSKGLCQTRTNRNGQLFNEVYGGLSSFSTDFIEKVPLYHFYPNHRFLTVGGIGCNLSCKFCLTWSITQKPPTEIEAEFLTHSEPTLNVEFFSKVMERSRAEGLMNVFATNGFISIEAFERVAGWIDAVALTFKGKAEFYRQVCGVNYSDDHFRRLIESIMEQGIHLEIIYVLVPGENDDEESLNEVIELSKYAKAPLIFLRFFPSYRMEGVDSPSEEILEGALNLAYQMGVEYAYMENIFEHPGKNTYCPNCRCTLIKREGYGIVSWRIREGRCSECKTAIRIKGEALFVASSV